jgi:hypothetical protein
MAKGKDPVFVPVLPPDSEKCSIKFDQHLEELLDTQSIVDRGEQMLVLDALGALGLVNHKMYTEDDGSQEHNYTSTKEMRKLAKEWLYSPKRWRLPGER